MPEFPFLLFAFTYCCFIIGGIHQLVHVTGGVPRYLVEYNVVGCMGKHYLMPEELSRQFDDVLLKLLPEKVCEVVIKIETTRVLPPNSSLHN